MFIDKQNQSKDAKEIRKNTSRQSSPPPLCELLTSLDFEYGAMNFNYESLDDTQTLPKKQSPTCAPPPGSMPWWPQHAASAVQVRVATQTNYSEVHLLVIKV
eukprot:1157654-Pelagomonas_calceolata.AAC.11